MFFCHDNEKKKEESCFKGMIIGGIIAVASMMAIRTWRKMKFRKVEKVMQEFEMEQMNAEKSGYDEELDKVNEKMEIDDENIELKEKVDEFNSRRITKENEA